MEKNWKRFERRVAHKFSGTRIPITGRGNLDIAHPLFGIECKYRKNLPDWLFGNAIRQAVEGSGKERLPIVVVGQHNKSEMYVVMRVGDFLDMAGAAYSYEPDYNEGHDYHEVG